MNSFQSNLLVRFSVVSFVVMAVSAVVIGSLLTNRLEREIGLLKMHEQAMMQGKPMGMGVPYSITSLTENVKQLKWLIGGFFAVGFLVLYGGPGYIVWGGWKTIKIQKNQLETFNHSLAQQVEDRTAELEAFSYSVSHDLRAPLRSINGFGQVLYEDYADKIDDQGRDYLERILSSTRNMETLIDGLLELARLSRSTMEASEIDISELANSIAADLRESQPKRDVSFSIQDHLVATGDPRLLRVALENLLGNAWKYTAKHSQALIEFGANGHDGNTGSKDYFVRDDGAGFDMAYADKLFGAFQRLHPVSEFEGTGIGLATVRRIVQRHGGRVWAEGEVDRGATFYFTLGSNASGGENG